MELKPNCGSDRAWVWNVSADYADEEAKMETLAIRFANAECMKNTLYKLNHNLLFLRAWPIYTKR